ncbi:MAG: hypothetical protein ACI4EI_09995, partial [Muricoprocola sp.]
ITFGDGFFIADLGFCQAKRLAEQWHLNCNILINLLFDILSEKKFTVNQTMTKICSLFYAKK